MDNFTINLTNKEDGQFCFPFPSTLYPVIHFVVFANALFGFSTNLLIFISYIFFKTQKKLSTTEYFITFLSVADMTFSASVVIVFVLDRVLSPDLLENCTRMTVQALLHAFEQFLSWLLFLNISFERFLSICKVSYANSLLFRNHLSNFMYKQCPMSLTVMQGSYEEIQKLHLPSHTYTQTRARNFTRTCCWSFPYK